MGTTRAQGEARPNRDQAATAKVTAALAVMRDAGAASDEAQVVEMEQMAGGWSRHSYALTVAEPGAGRREFVLRARPPGPLLDTDIVQEHRTYVLLADEPVAIPKVHGLDASEDTPFGGPFFVMDRLPGEAPNVWRGRDRSALEEDWAGPRGVARDYVANLAGIHGVGVTDLGGAIAPRGFLQTVDHWQEVQQRAQLLRDPVVETAFAWVRDREPDPVAPCLVHGDYRIGNCLVADGRITAVLDWELSTVGDPRFDLAYMSLKYFGGKFTRPGSELLGAVAEREWLYERYESLSGRRVDPDVVRTFAVLGALSLIAIMNTGIRVYADGGTTDIRMAWSRFVFPGLRQDLAALMDW
jgi:aminoglycoside phosphotransferase (APT) family kinase protein